eukprot:gb/GECH01000981.1/.p1 GENE.gb/GECH01000981.1/~~gb/GECH01000981.1/.p1  ORF type:complete len:275 (+),score=43.77 gb/GECH01000981.1/:1-825(+)
MDFYFKSSIPREPQDLKIMVSTMAISFLSFLVVYQISGFLSWHLSKAYRNMSQNDRAYWNSCVTSSVNAVWSFLFGSYAFWTEKHLFAEFITGESKIASQAISSLAGYLLFDTVLCLIYFMKTKGTAFTLAHHLAGIISGVFSAGNQFALHVVLIFVMTEFSTPLVNMIYFLKTTGYRHSVYYHLNSWMLYFAFAIARIALPIPYLLIQLYWKRTKDIFLTCPFALFCLVMLMPAFYFLLNGFWFFLMTKHLLKTYIFPSTSNRKDKPKPMKED